MRNIARLFIGDLRRLTSNIATLVIVIGLIGVPGLFTWFNVASSWDPFHNTSALRFAVANTDTCYDGDILPTRVCIGDQVVNELRSNTQLDWTFTTKDDAIDGTKSGKYYAAVVIPPSFSEHMMTFFDHNMKHAQLDYYTNEKLNAMAPKVTGQGADQVAAQINTMFSQTITSTALRLANSISKVMDSPQAAQYLGQLTTHMNQFADTMDTAAQTINAYEQLTDAASGVIDGATQVVSSTGKVSKQAENQLKLAKNGVSSAGSALQTTSQAVNSAIRASVSSTTALSTAIQQTLDNSTATSADMSKFLNTTADGIAQQASRYQRMHDTVAQLLGSNSVAAVQLQHIVDQFNSLHDTLTTAATDLTSKTADANAQHEQIQQLAASAASSCNALSQTLHNDLQTQFDGITHDVQDMQSVLKQGSDSMQSTLLTIQTSAGSAQQQLDAVRSSLQTLRGHMEDNARDIRDLSTKLQTALQAGDMDTVRNLLKSDPDSVAAKLAAPVVVKRTALYPTGTFGTALTPFYTFIPLWVGALLSMVTLKPRVSRSIREELERRNTLKGHNKFGGRVHSWQLFIGRWLTIATIMLMQATFSCGGSLLFMRIDSVHPWAFMLAGWASALVYSFIAYTLVFSFGNIGKAIGVIILVMQISATGGAYPLEILPSFISNIAPYLPVTHSIQMARAAIGGFYQHDFWIELGKLFLFIPPCALFALIFGKPLSIYNRWYQRNIDKAKVIA